MAGGVLVVGHVCVDIVNYCLRYPEEDSDVGSNPNTASSTSHGLNRCTDQRWQRGGNAANTASVLAALECPVEFVGSLPNGPLLSFLLDDFAASGIGVAGCQRFDADCPTSCVIVSQASHTRTIVHSNKNLPEISADHFHSLDLSPYRWIHFEGRNISNVFKMIHRVRGLSENTEHAIRISVELEKPHRRELDALLPLADVVFVSKEFARSRGSCDMEDAVNELRHFLRPDALVVCAWGEQGAAASRNSPSESTVSCRAVDTTHIVDTLAAGDSFIAGVIWAILCHDAKPGAAIAAGCRVAAVKIAMKGFAELKHHLPTPRTCLLENI